MSFLCLYILVIFAALIWVGVDKDAIGAFEFLSRTDHANARDMGIYSEFVRYSLGRLAFLTILVTLNVVVAFLMFAKNPFEFGTVNSGHGAWCDACRFTAIVRNAASFSLPPSQILPLFQGGRINKLGFHRLVERWGSSSIGVSGIGFAKPQ
jgi:hypothetical protein